MEIIDKRDDKINIIEEEDSYLLNDKEFEPLLLNQIKSRINYFLDTFDFDYSILFIIYLVFVLVHSIKIILFNKSE